MQINNMLKLGIAAAIIVGGVVVFTGGVGHNDDQNWQVLQYPNGEVKIIDEPGWYGKWFGNVWTYPRNWQFEFTNEISDENPTDESTKVTFNDGSTADMNTMIVFTSPPTLEQKREFHRRFGGSKDAIKNSIWGHLSNVLKASGPLMSASENQAARKSEFNKVTYEQMNEGLYEMRRVERTLDQVDEKGNPIKVIATEIVYDKAGKPIISQVSPLKLLGLNVTQLSITDTIYDEQTRRQFALKKEAFLQAESSKAQREGEVQQRLMIIERGLREKAETEAASNREKAEAVIRAEKEKEVAEKEAAKLLAVAKLDKETAETAAMKQLEVARLERQAAEERAKQIIELAKAERERIVLGGALTEEKRVLAEIQAKRDVEVAKALGAIAVPSTVITGGTGNGSESEGGVNANLMNLTLLRAMGVLK